jgi:hypothetical protein
MKKFVFISVIVIFTIIIVIPNKSNASIIHLPSNIYKIPIYPLLPTKIPFKTIVLGIIYDFGNIDLYTKNYNTNTSCYHLDIISEGFMINKLDEKWDKLYNPYFILPPFYYHNSDINNRIESHNKVSLDLSVVNLSILQSLILRKINN